MTRRMIIHVGMSFVLMAVLWGWSVGCCQAAAAGLDTAKIEQLTGVKGELIGKEGVFKVSVPRTDLAVTALHNHFFWDTPKVMFMHIGGMGPDETLAGAVGMEAPRVVFLHYWGMGATRALAKGLKAALDTQHH